MRVTTIATAFLPHLFTAELLRDDTAHPSAPLVDAWRDFAWNVRVGRYQLCLSSNRIGGAEALRRLWSRARYELGRAAAASRYGTC